MVRKKRVSLKISQAQLAFEINSDGRHIRRIEKGEVNLSFITLLRISKTLEIDLKELFDFEID